MKNTNKVYYKVGDYYEGTGIHEILYYHIRGNTMTFIMKKTVAGLENIHAISKEYFEKMFLDYELLPFPNIVKSPKFISIYDLSEEHLFNIANIATGGYFKSSTAKNHKEVETGGYGRRRQVIWEQDGEDSTYYFEINASGRNNAWNWYSWEIDISGKKYEINTVDTALVVDYCDSHGIDLRNLNESYD